jgi:tetratricopeptide (TPR) repeat protein
MSRATSGLAARRYCALLLAVLLAGATLASYAPTFSADFVDIDDPDYVPENEMVTAGLSRDGVVWAFSGMHAGNWFPLTWISHMTDVALFGVEPAGHHAMNVGLHVANAVLLFAVLVSMTGALTPSLLVAGIFALHPVNVESVAWISQRKTTLATFFALLAIGSYARWSRVGGRLCYGGSLLAFALSLLAKQMFVPLPFALLLLDYWPLRRTEFDPAAGALPSVRSLARGVVRLLPEKLPYLVLGVAASGATWVAQGEAIATGATYPLAVRLGNAVIAVPRYLGSLFAPTKLAVFYPLYEDEVTLPLVAACAALGIAISAAALWFGRRHRPLLVGWFWFLGLLIPVIGMVQIGAQSMADRYLYVPCWGLGIAVAFSAWEVAETRRMRRGVFAAATGLLLAVLAVATHQQAEKWRDSITLFEAAVAADDRNYIAHRALAAQYFNRGDYARALRHAEAGLHHPRDLGEVLPIYGMALYQTGSKQAAIEQLVRATQVAPTKPMGFTNLGWVYLQEGRYELAVEALSAALGVDPSSARAAQLLATTQSRLGRPDEAAASYARVVALDPMNFDARIEWARALGVLGRLAESAAVLGDALDAAREFPGAQREQLTSTLHLYRGDAFSLRHETERAIGEYESALLDWPETYAATYNLATLLATAPDRGLRGDPQRAVSLAERAVALSSRRRPEALATLAVAYEANGQREAAVQVAREALAVARETNDAAAIAAVEAQLRTLTAATDPEQR